MRVVVQRVKQARVVVDDRVVGSIGHGLCLLVGVARSDDDEDVAAAVDKIVTLRIFADDEGRMNRSVRDVEGEVLVVSQFTLLADTRKGRRPSFVEAAEPRVAAELIDAMVERIAERGLGVATGVFGARMEVDLVNEGPVTIVIDVKRGVVG